MCMKKSAFATLVLILPSVLLCAQLRLLNNSLSTPDSAVLYIGINNRISINGLPTVASVSLRNGEMAVVADKDGFFNIATSQKGNLPVAVYVGNQKKHEVLFSVRRIPDPVVVLGRWRNAAINKDSLLGYHRLEVVLPDCLARYKDNVLSFDVQINNGGTDSPVHHVKGDSLPGELLAMVRQLQAGGQLVFSNIVCQGIANHWKDGFSLVVQ